MAQSSDKSKDRTREVSSEPRKDDLFGFGYALECASKAGYNKVEFVIHAEVPAPKALELLRRSRELGFKTIRLRAEPRGTRTADELELTFIHDAPPKH
jgi:hypothetical protein